MRFWKRVFACVCAVSFLPLASAARAQGDSWNCDFESGAVGAKPDGWVSPTGGYKIEVTDAQPNQGKLCAVLRNANDQPGAGFGNLLRSFDATPYRGKTVRFKAAVRVAGATPQDRAQLWFRVDRPNKQMGFFDNMGDRPIRDGAWKTYEIVGDVEPDAERLSIGCMLMRLGNVWLDDIALEIIGDAKPSALEPPRALEGRALENLVAFTKLLGYVRYFYPGDEAAKTNWETFAVNGVRAVEAAKTPAELADTLNKLFQPVAPQVLVYAKTDNANKSKLDFKPPAGVAAPRFVAAWDHLGVGGGTAQSIYRSKREFKPYEPDKPLEGFAAPDQPWRAELGGGVACVMPLTVFADETGTLPRAAAIADQPEAKTRPSGNDRAVRLADVALAWNVFQHFYPYFDVVQTDWNAVLRDSLTRAATDKDERAFLDTLRLLVAALQDGHGFVSHGSDNAQASLPVLFDWVENRLIVTAVAKDARNGNEGAADIKPGDVVLKINGRPAADALADVERFVSGATPQWKRHVALRRLVAGPADEKAVLEIEAADGKTRAATLAYGSREEALKEPRPEKIVEVRPGVWYVDIDRINDKDLNAALPQLEKAKGIVFDLRGYPGNLSPVVLSHLIDSPVTCARWNIPIVRRPDREGMEFQFSNWQVTPVAPKFAAKAAFVIDGRAISYAETYMGIVEHYKLAEIVGIPTAGTNGNVNPFTLPGGYRISWTGMKVLKHDGARHHGIGIRPTVPATRTLAGVRAGKDELLERAIEVVAPKE